MAPFLNVRTGKVKNVGADFQGAGQRTVRTQRPVKISVHTLGLQLCGPAGAGAGADDADGSRRAIEGADKRTEALRL